MKQLSLLLFIFIHINVMAQNTDTVYIENLMLKHADLFAGILNHPKKNQVQVLYTQVDRDSRNKPTFKTFSYNLDDHRYF